MFQILKELIEKPENLRLYVIYFLKIILSIIISTRIYSYLFGTIEPILIGDENFWKDIYEFIITGKVLIVTAIFFFSKVVILELISSMTFFILHLIPKLFSSKKKSIMEGADFRTMFKFLGILKIEKGSDRIPQPGRNYHIAMDVVNNSKKSDLHDAVLEIKNTSIFEFFNLYLAFTMVYFFFLNSFSHLVINYALIIGFVLLFMVLMLVEQLFKMIEFDYENLVKSLKWIHQINMTEEYIKINGFNAPVKNELAKRLPYTSEIVFNDSAYFIVHYMEGQRIGNFFKRIREENFNGQILLVTNTKLPKVLSFYLKKELVKVIRFSDKDNLIKKLDKVFFKVVNTDISTTNHNI